MVALTSADLLRLTGATRQPWPDPLEEGWPMIARTWRGWVRTADRDAYVAYVRRTGIAQYRATPGNVEAHLLTRDLDDGRTEVVTLSFWTSLDAVRGFAGEDVDAAVFYPEDDRWLVDREVTVVHHEVHG